MNYKVIADVITILSNTLKKICDINHGDSIYSSGYYDALNDLSSMFEEAFCSSVENKEVNEKEFKNYD